MELSQGFHRLIVLYQIRWNSKPCWLLPIHPTLHFEIIWFFRCDSNMAWLSSQISLNGPEVMTIHICAYIIRLLSLQGQKLSRKSFRVPFLRQGSFFKINESNISEATELCLGSKLGFLRRANITRPFSDVYYVYCTCMHVYAREIHVYTREIHILHTWEWSNCVCHHQEPPLWPLAHFWVTMREILSLKPHEYTWNTHVSQLKIV